MKAKVSGLPAEAEHESVAIGATVETLKEGVAKATADIGAVQAQMKDHMAKTARTMEELAVFNQGNVEAMLKSGQIWASGLQGLSQHIAAAAQSSFDDGVSTFKALSGVKSLKDAIDLQTAFARATLERTLTESGKLTDASFKLTEQTLAPLTARVSLAVEKFAKA